MNRMATTAGAMGVINLPPTTRVDAYRAVDGGTRQSSHQAGRSTDASGNAASMTVCGVTGVTFGCLQAVIESGVVGRDHADPLRRLLIDPRQGTHVLKRPKCLVVEAPGHRDVPQRHLHGGYGDARHDG
jgi:hypothetical protein